MNPKRGRCARPVAVEMAPLDAQSRLAGDLLTLLAASVESTSRVSRRPMLRLPACCCQWLGAYPADRLAGSCRDERHRLCSRAAGPGGGDAPGWRWAQLAGRPMQPGTNADPQQPAGCCWAPSIRPGRGKGSVSCSGARCWPMRGRVAGARLPAGRWRQIPLPRNSLPAKVRTRSNATCYMSGLRGRILP